MRRSEKEGKFVLVVRGPFTVYCYTCDNTLYEPSQDDWVTRRVANETVARHRKFAPEHVVDIIDPLAPLKCRAN